MGQAFNESLAHCGVLSAWQTLQAFGIFRETVWLGGTKRKVLTTDVDVRNLRFDFWHVAADTLIARAARPVVSVRLNRGRVRAVRRVGAVTFEAHHISWFQEVRIVFRSVRVVAAIAADAVCVHGALNKIVALHPVFVRRAIGEMRERLLS